MESDHEELYLQKLKRFVYDEDKIVTSVWLSQTLSLNIKLCTNLLARFVEDQKTKSQPVGANYILTGKINDETDKSIERHTVMLVNEESLGPKMKLFINTPAKSVYSVQKAKDVNHNSIAMVDPFNGASILGSIVSANCTMRNNLRTSKVLPSVSRTASTDKTKASHLFGNKSNTTKVVVSKEVKKDEPKKEENKKLTKQGSNEKGTNKQGNNIANMFAKAPPAKEKKVELVEAMVIDDSDDDDEDSSKKEPTTTTKKTIGKEVKKESLYDSGTDEEAKKVEEKNKGKAKKTKESNGSAKKKNSKNKRQRQDQSNEQPQKKRKRILEHVDSDEDIFASNDEAEDVSQEIIESDDEPVVKKQAKPLPEKNKKRQLVDKTYTDEDGYVVTKKEWVYDSNAEDEDDDKEEDKENPPNAKKPVQETKAKKTSPKTTSPTKAINKNKKQPAKPTNQPTLMSFFKKK